MTLDEYKLAREAWVRREYDKLSQKPIGMLGHWAWYVVKEREFKKYLKDKGIDIPKSML